jgi:hypothetical protein
VIHDPERCSTCNRVLTTDDPNSDLWGTGGHCLACVHEIGASIGEDSWIIGPDEDEQCRWAAEEFANATSEQRDAMIEMVRQAGRSMRGYWMGETLGWGTIEYENMTDEQKRIVDAGNELAGQFPEGLTKEQLSAWIRDPFAPDDPSSQIFAGHCG